MPWKLFYDGECNLCNASQLKVVQWADRIHYPLVTEILQSGEAKSKGYSDGSIVLEAEDKIYYAEDAWFKLLEIAPWYFRWLVWLKWIPGVRFIAGIIYKIVAKYRFRWFGRRKL